MKGGLKLVGRGTVSALLLMSIAPAAHAAAPAAPSGVTVVNASTSSTGLNAAQATVNWTPVTGAIAYDLTAKSITGPTITSQLTGFSASSTSLSRTLTGLLGGASYTFVVTAINADGKTPSDAVTFTTQSVPDAPTGFTATAGVKQATLKWAAPANNGGLSITGYTVSTVEAPDKIYPQNASATSAAITGLQNATSYTFQIAAVNSNGISLFEKAVKITTPDVPGVPTGVSGTVSGSTATIQWAAPTSAGNSTITGYALHIYDSSSAELTAFAQLITSTSATVTGLSSGSYTAKVAAVNAVGTSSLSSASAAFVVASASTLTANSPVFTPQRITDQSVGSTAAIAATAPSGGLVTISVSPTTVCTYSSVTGLITSVSPGVCSVVATTPSTATYASGSTSLSFNILKLSQTVNFNSISPQTMPGPLQLSATATSGTAVQFVATGSCTVSGSTLTFTGAGSCTVAASAPASDRYNAAPSVTQTFGIAAAPTTTTSSVSGGGGGGGGPAPAPALPAPSPSPTPSPISSASATPTPVPAETTNVKPTPTPTPTLSVTPTPSPSRMPTATPTPSPATSAPNVSLVKSIVPAPTASQAKLIIATKVITIPSGNVSAMSLSVNLSKSSSVSTSIAIGKAISISLPKVPTGTKISYLFVGPKNKLVTISSATTKTVSAGTLPLIAFKAPGKYTLVVTVGKVTKTITVTVKK